MFFGKIPLTGPTSSKSVDEAQALIELFIGARRLQALAERYSPDVVAWFCDELIAYTERLQSGNRR